MNKSIKPNMCELSSFKLDCLIWDPKSIKQTFIEALNVYIHVWWKRLLEVQGDTTETKANEIDEKSITECYHNFLWVPQDNYCIGSREGSE